MTAPKMTPYRPSDMSGDQFYTNATGDRLLPTEGSILKMDSYGPNDRELELKPKGYSKAAYDNFNSPPYDKGLNPELADQDFINDDGDGFDNMG